ncbi:hypothetical protein [Methylobacterium sp.]|uniref:hypothetical protein n=1 Tax=Methylobacterium sp. TaxID=409 RepID=UPI000C48C990|nr:hypothetical protein [Methylobacterium sp.]MBP32391.1 hypothetical protein [Methylobacterium sp.]
MEIKTVEQMMIASGRRAASLEDELSPALQTSVAHQVLDDHYRVALDQSIAMLGDKTPRASVRSRAGRESVAAWLKFLESESRHGRASDDPMTSYDFGWLWSELGIANLRR